ncbi:hypothetical protein [Pandoraea pulmonicola]|uniref:hypothetical protein n=1 Tax=Pandoraea pulmonicola TaxID=93221 RepID=UPI0011C03FF1|nr:hypothetical protein [Pandoraea pulmonicola]
MPDPIIFMRPDRRTRSDDVRAAGVSTPAFHRRFQTNIRTELKRPVTAIAMSGNVCGYALPAMLPEFRRGLRSADAKSVYRASVALISIANEDVFLVVSPHASGSSLYCNSA